MVEGKAPAKKRRPEVVEAVEQVVETEAPSVEKPKRVQVPTTAVTFRRRLSQGDRGAVVTEVQRILAARKLWDGPQDGRYGIMLARAVRRFQSDSGLRVTGEVDVNTWKVLTK